MARWSRRAFIAAGVTLAGCAVPGRPPLGPIYATTRENGGQPPLVVIPGAFGSSLRDRRTGREIWPGTNPQLLVSNYRALELDIDPDTLEPLAGDEPPGGDGREGEGPDAVARAERDALRGDLDHLHRRAPQILEPVAGGEGIAGEVGLEHGQHAARRIAVGGGGRVQPVPRAADLVGLEVEHGAVPAAGGPLESVHPLGRGGQGRRERAEGEGGQVSDRACHGYSPSGRSKSICTTPM